MARAVYVLYDGELIKKSVDGVTTEEYMKAHEGKQRANPFNGFGSDSLPGGVNGIVNHADGKRYDSKSQYNRAVIAKGCRVVGNDWNKQDLRKSEVSGDFHVRPELTRVTRDILGRVNGR